MVGLPVLFGGRFDWIVGLFGFVWWAGGFLGFADYGLGVEMRVCLGIRYLC